MPDESPDQKQVRWLPLESNPDVMNSFLHNLGLPSKWAVTDVYGLDPEMLAMVPQPVSAVLLLYPLTEKAVTASADEDAKIQAEGQVQSPKVYFMRQTIGNACGTVALMHALANNKEMLQLESGPLAEFFSRTAQQTPEERAAALQLFQQLEAAHEAAGHQGQTEAPSRHDRLDTHFIAFVHVDGHLYELDGRRPAPVNHGPTSQGSLLPDAAKVVKSFMERDPTEVNFSVLALASAQ
ncbi:ubiquitin carboxyl-terminal hydrolase isozyme L3-like [Pollicipes pollicipes]|uniref:ubiquitin carboxyl-terminal hydrolase isozyme L3-like n=1 Tax=Pollicipes pollicipes TaxID=41117 RepID=UPI00188558E0|nr:ubiquitin carboxyl-terminal hydrolase isozyme L3-like [Pollicipes pollicipes]XP_037070984.1 ubiquitin carboxyl-terminal hydrolase isozyme L3-like [Pollicipes pollicipes]XP_037070985.1 ubiquitin carboxyl-terminal hydrolase isozyme L3-like [Pollicipes pollicipes]XP_037070986.1 ubiquitin carboxyl-terminal hydrolase isozyme L3-like [Pollicipes pollicipes]XP_037070987.1 ubiquitin carboxyl-terminal hydrolase isozyme L3-like [Pollicipes pollicipes]XP_037070988.1 ubiquitin carboxyl-terminal hydrola